MEVFHFFLYNFRMNELKDCHDDINFQTEYLVDIAKDANYGYDLDTAQQFHDWEHHKHEDILTYRDRSHASKFTGTQSPIHHSTFMKALDDSMATFLNTKRWNTTGWKQIKLGVSELIIVLVWFLKAPRTVKEKGYVVVKKHFILEGGVVRIEILRILKQICKNLRY